MAVTEFAQLPGQRRVDGARGRPDAHTDVLGLRLQPGQADQPVGVAGRGGHLADMERHLLVAAAGGQQEVADRR